jgi:hypothetical protein
MSLANRRRKTNENQKFKKKTENELHFNDKNIR